MEDGKAYKERVNVAEQNLILFRKSVENCSIPTMLDNSLRFFETIKNADNLYFSLHPNIQKKEIGTFNKSQNLKSQYFEHKANIGNFCVCRAP